MPNDRRAHAGPPVVSLLPGEGALPLLRSCGRPIAGFEDGREVYVVRIDKALAARLVKYMDPLQRTPSGAHVANLARAMSRGEWQAAVSPMNVDQATGLFIDGSHRLRAVIESDTAQDFMIMITHRRVLAALDIGRKRGVTDVAKMLRGSQIMGAVGVAAQHAHFGFDRGAMQRASHAERVVIVERCPYQAELADLWSHRRIRCSAGVLAAALLCMSKDRDAACDFFRAVFANEHAVRGEESTQVRVLATWIVGRRSVSGGGEVRESAVRSLLLWNMWCRRHPAVVSKYSSAYPIPVPLTPKR